MHLHEVDFDVGSEFGFVDDEEIRTHDCGAAFSRNVAALGDIDDVDEDIGELGGEGCGEVIAAAFDEDEFEIEEAGLEVLDCFEIHGNVIADCGVRAASGFDAEDAVGIEGGGADEHLRVLFGVDVIRDDGHVSRLTVVAAESEAESGFTGADGSADSDSDGISFGHNF